MKKSLLALAALSAFAGAASAESSVNVYGIMDLGYASITNGTGSSATNNNKVTGMQNGGLSSPRLGVKGTEELGGGTKANFLMEMEIGDTNGQVNGIGPIKTGASAGPTAGVSNGILFSRGAWVGLSDAKYGEARFGLQNTAMYDNVLEFDALKGANLGGAVNVASITTGTSGTGNSLSNRLGDRITSSFSYTTPTFYGVNLKLDQGQKSQDYGALSYYTNGADAAGVRLSEATLRYNYNNKANLVATIGALASSAGTSGNSGTAAGTMAYGFYGNYDFGLLNVLAFSTNLKGQGNYNGIVGSNTRENGFGVRAPITSKITVGAQYTSMHTGQAVNSDGNVAAAVVEYALSKRTTAYVLGAVSSNQASGGVQLDSSTKFSNAQQGSLGLNQTGYMIGMRHAF